MAKQSDQLAGAPKVEKNIEKRSPKGGSSGSGLFAEENEFDRRVLWRIGSWGAVAVGAVAVAMMSNQWSLGFRREQAETADLARQAQQIQSLAKESQNETRRLASAIETLNNDRDRLFARVTVIEQGLDSVTGALAKQTTSASGPSAAPQTSADQQASTSNLAAGAPQFPQQNDTAALAPVPGPVATMAATSPPADKPRADPAKADAAAGAAMAAPPPAAGTLVMAKSMMGPPDPAAPRLLREGAKSGHAKLTAIKSIDAKSTDAKATDVKTADANPADIKAPDTKAAEADVDAKAEARSDDVVASIDAVDEPEVTSVAVKRTDFAVELGAANSLGGLRAIWRTVRHLNGELGALNPIIVIREGHTATGMQLHLAAGPLKDAAAAAKICAMLTETKHSCETTVYDGQRLAMKVDEGQSLPAKAPPESTSESKSDTQPDAKPDGKMETKSSWSRHGWSRHAKKEESPAPPPPAPKPPEQTTSSFSTLFSRK